MISNGTIIINYRGRYGNKLFTYFSARIYAEKNRLNLLTDPPNDCLEIKDNIIFGENPANLKTIHINDFSYFSYDKEIEFKGNGNYIWSGTHQYENIFFDNRELILSWIVLEKVLNQEAVIHIRISDFIYSTRHLVVNREYYKYCIKNYTKNYDSITIVTEYSKSKFENDYINDIKEYIESLNKKVKLSRSTLKDDFFRIVNADLIITSNSTFCFWGSFISNSNKIICFPHVGIDILRDITIKIWRNNPIIFKNKLLPNIIINNDYSTNIIDYFDNKVYE